jgi:hypothetical protein
MSDTRQHVHELIDQLPPAKLNAVAGLLEVMIQDDEPVTDEDRQRFREGRDWFAQHGKGIPIEEVLAEFGLKPEDFPLHK